MAKLLRKKKVFPDLILSSTAVRAYEYAKILAKELSYQKSNIIATKDLYMADEDDLLSTIQAIKDKIEIVFLVGHNPDITNFANSLSDDHIDNIPTSGIFSVEFDVDKWENVKPGKGRFVSFEFPKKYFK